MRFYLSARALHVICVAKHATRLPLAFSCETCGIDLAMCMNVLAMVYYLCGHSHHYFSIKAKTGCSWFRKIINGQAIQPVKSNHARPCNSCVNTDAYYKRETRLAAGLNLFCGKTCKNHGGLIKHTQGFV
jgi:hypothetical protein